MRRLPSSKGSGNSILNKSGTINMDAIYSGTINMDAINENESDSATHYANPLDRGAQTLSRGASMGIGLETIYERNNRNTIDGRSPLHQSSPAFDDIGIPPQESAGESPSHIGLSSIYNGSTESLSLGDIQFSNPLHAGKIKMAGSSTSSNSIASIASNTSNASNASNDSSSLVEKCEWGAVVDRSTGESYYYNARTEQTTLTKPPAFAKWEKWQKAASGAAIRGREAGNNSSALSATGTASRPSAASAVL